MSEDTADYTLGDVNGRIAKTSAILATVTNIHRDEESILHRALATVGDFEIDIEMNTTPATIDEVGCFCGLAEEVGSFTKIGGAGKHAICAMGTTTTPANNNWYLWERRNGGSQSDSVADAPGSHGVYRYGTMVCVGTTLEFHIYSDAARTILIDTLTLTLGETPDFTRVYWVQSYEDGVAATREWDCLLRNFDLNPGAVSVPPWRKRIGDRRKSLVLPISGNVIKL
jgi:hypothetical protein